MPDTSVQLTCEQCKKRKVKCDKLSPCSSCRASGFVCQPVQRARLPRGRTGKAKKHNSSLDDKVARLEKLLEAVEKQAYLGSTSSAIDPRSGDSSRVSEDTCVSQSPNRVEDFVAKDFWLALSNEVSGLRETLEASENEDETPQNPMLRDSDEEDPSQRTRVIFFLANSPYANGNGVAYNITASVHDVLLGVYRSRVDPIMKVVHWPTILEMSKCDESSQSAPIQALRNAINFLAVCSMTQADCEVMAVGDRAQLIKHFRDRAETTLNAANFLTSSDIVVLQAFVLYLTCLRCCMEANTAWTLVSLAVRMADACGIKDCASSAANPFEAEQCRRLWFSIGLLDSQTAFGRGSLPLLSHRDLMIAPRNLNDQEMSLGNVATVSASSFTDMTFSYLCYHAMICQRKLCDPLINVWQDRVNLVTGFEIEVNRHFGQFEFSDVPIQRYTALGARDMSATMNLLLRRPPYKHESPDAPLTDDFDLMGTARRALQSGLFKQSHGDFEPYRWFSWPKWYVLAVLLVELLNYQRTATYERAYEVARQSYLQYAQSASEATSSTLWKPLTRLMRRVDELRNIADSQQWPEVRVDYVDTLLHTRDIGIADQPKSINTSLDNAQNASGLSVWSVDSVSEGAWLRWNSFLDQLNDPWDPMQEDHIV